MSANFRSEPCRASAILGFLLAFACFAQARLAWGQSETIISTLTVLGTDSDGYSVKLTSGITMPSGTITGGLFVGDGSGLTKVVHAAGDTMTGQLTLAGSTLTVTGNAFSVGATTLTISAGKVGIGTASPAQKVHLSSGTLYLDGSSPTIKFAELNNNSINFGASRIINAASAMLNLGDLDNNYDQVSIIGSHVASPLIFKAAGGTEFARFLNSNLGIGTTNPIYPLHVNGAASLTGHVLFGATATVSGNAFSVGGATFAVTFGSVGVGLTAPQSRFHVLDGDIRISTSPGAASRGLIFQDGSVQTIAAGSSQWVTNGTDISNANPGNVGVGTTAPVATLDVGGGAQFGSGATKSTFSAAGFLALDAAAVLTVGGAAASNGTVIVKSTSATAANPVLALQNSSGSGLFRVRQDGKVGVGTDTPNALLDINGTAQFGSGATKSSFSAAGFLALDPAAVLTVGGAAASNGTVIIKSTSATTANPVLALQDNSGTELMRVNQEGSVGLGTTNPESKLTIMNGDLRLYSNVTGVMYYNRTDQRMWRWGQRTQSSRVLEFIDDTVGATRMVLGTNGGLGVGTTTDLLSMLSVEGSATIGAGYASSNGPTNGLAVQGNAGFGTAAPAAQMHVSSGTTSLLIDGNAANAFQVGVSTFVIGQNGRVGVGTAIPNTTLDVNGAAQFGSGTTKSTFSAAGFLALDSAAVLTVGGAAASNGTVIIKSTSATAANPVLALQNNSGTELMRIRQDGKVGINAAVPATTLDVAGSAQFGSESAKSTFTATPGNANYALELSSGIKLAAGGIRWADGSTSTTAATTAASLYNIAFASGTVNQSTTLTTWVSVTGSTVSLTVSANSRVRISFSGANTNTGTMAVNALVDGALLCPAGSPDYGCGAGRDRNNDVYMTPFILLTNTLTAGAHNFSIVHRVADVGTSLLLGSPPWSIIVEEVR